MIEEKEDNVYEETIYRRGNPESINRRCSTSLAVENVN